MFCLLVLVTCHHCSIRGMKTSIKLLSYINFYNRILSPCCCAPRYLHTFVLIQTARNWLLIATEHPLKAGFPVTFNRKSNQNSWSVLVVSGISWLSWGHTKTPVGRRFILFLSYWWNGFIGVNDSSFHSFAPWYSCGCPKPAFAYRRITCGWLAAALRLGVTFSPPWSICCAVWQSY